MLPKVNFMLRASFFLILKMLNDQVALLGSCTGNFFSIPDRGATALKQRPGYFRIFM